MKIALTGSSGHMGIATLREFLKIEGLELVRVLLQKSEKVRNKLVLKEKKKHPCKMEILYGDVSNIEDIRKLAEGMDYFFNLAAVIPPKSDKFPHLSYLANEVGPLNMVKVLEEMKSVKFIDITSVALYGHRNDKHPFERVGDPLLPSVYDVYAAHKLRGEFAILESDIPNFVIIRQTAMIYLEMMAANKNDGLMFHTTFNDPLEWSTAEDSGLLMANIVKEDVKGNLSKDNFWNKVFNLGGGDNNRISGFETIDAGFRCIGKSAEKLYSPNDNCTRNFHGGFYYDGHKLDDLFHYMRDDFGEYWKKIIKKYPVMKMGALLPGKMLKNIAITPLYKDSNAPRYWYDNHEDEKLIAFFGSREAYENQPKEWKDFKMWDFKKGRELSNYKKIDYGFDIEKEDKDIDIKDLENVAKMHGGKLLSKSFKKGDLSARVKWENSDGEAFEARAYTVLRGGHWMNPLYKELTWDFDRLAKKDKIFAAYWYDSHELNEDHCYYMDKDYKARIK